MIKISIFSILFFYIYISVCLPWAWNWCRCFSSNIGCSYCNFCCYFWFNMVPIKKISKKRKDKKLINYLLTFFVSICVYELIIFLKFFKIIETNFKILKKIIDLFSNKKNSDSIKEKLIMDYSKSLFTSSIKIFLIILVIIFLIFIINNLFSSFYSFLFSNTGIIETVIIIIVYHSIRKRINAKL